VDHEHPAPDAAAGAHASEAVLDGLRQAADVHGQPLTGAKYDGFAAEHGLLSRVRIIQRWGSWNAACTDAGLAVNTSHAGHASKWTDETLLGHVGAYLEEPGSSGSYAGYRAYASQTEGAPSAQTVRNRFGSWNEAKRLAKDVLGASDS
jgi:hypothetical protein